MFPIKSSKYFSEVHKFFGSHAQVVVTLDLTLIILTMSHLSKHQGLSEPGLITLLPTVLGQIKGFTG
ncbi:hypothetical protein MBAV_002690 [Candidatus Magnetobacterium bavaricum]|uniref:Uncharacterized protein n=1 Tax=Candidatus Magnetobacterium bavaricum TaxID=29290 RepID=A0A0F3GTC9_9BACT|nr:hypothetical protein MBAV_002690 [Candidatus Magnetobacterium bavaricum]